MNENIKLSDQHGAGYLERFIKEYIPEGWKEPIGSVLMITVGARDWCYIKYMAEFSKKFLKYPCIMEAIEKFFEINKPE